MGLPWQATHRCGKEFLHPFGIAGRDICDWLLMWWWLSVEDGFPLPATNTYGGKYLRLLRKWMWYLYNRSSLLLLRVSTSFVKAGLALSGYSILKWGVSVIWDSRCVSTSDSLSFPLSCTCPNVTAKLSFVPSWATSLLVPPPCWYTPDLFRKPSCFDYTTSQHSRNWLLLLSVTYHTPPQIAE
jgi:hypothetical protein